MILSVVEYPAPISFHLFQKTMEDLLKRLGVDENKKKDTDQPTQVWQRIIKNTVMGDEWHVFLYKSLVWLSMAFFQQGYSPVCPLLAIYFDILPMCITKHWSTGRVFTPVLEDRDCVFDPQRCYIHKTLKMVHSASLLGNYRFMFSFCVNMYS